MSYGIVPFGKYKGQPVQQLQNDAQYCEWLSSQDWFRERYGNIYTVIINNFCVPNDTPEHNALQARFLDDDFVRAFIVASGHKSIKQSCVELERLFEKCKERFDEKQRQIDEQYREKVKLRNELSEELGACDSFEQFLQKVRENHLGSKCDSIGGCRAAYSGEIDKEINRSMLCGQCTKQEMEDGTCWCIDQSESLRENGYDIRVSFQKLGNDVQIFMGNYLYVYGNDGLEIGDLSIFVEIKPCIGDDYPSVIRQVLAKKNDHRQSSDVVVYNKFGASGVTLNQMKKMMEKSGITLISFDDVEQVLRKMQNGEMDK